MLETPHVVVGAAIAYKLVNPALAIPLALGSHFILEKVPHWNPHLNTEKKKYGRVTPRSTKIVLVDVCTSLLLGGTIAYLAYPNISHSATILIAAFIAALPDIVEGPYFFLDMKGKLIERWVAFQKSIQVDADLVPGLITQAATIIAAFWWILA